MEDNDIATRPIAYAVLLRARMDMLGHDRHYCDCGNHPIRLRGRQPRTAPRGISRKQCAVDFILGEDFVFWADVAELSATARAKMRALAQEAKGSTS